jgi:hypothetical protein
MVAVAFCRHQREALAHVEMDLPLCEVHLLPSPSQGHCPPVFPAISCGFMFSAQTFKKNILKNVEQCLKNTN